MTPEPNDLVMTTRVRLARNIENIPFVNKDKKLFEQIAYSIKNSNKNYFIESVDKMDPIMRNALFEQHLISKEFLDNTKYGIIVTRSDNKVIIMLGEEDHIRIQSIINNFDLNTAYTNAKIIADRLEKEFKIARDNSLGYLTKCPTNLGSGMRASVMMYLPALTLQGEIGEIRFNKITIRGVYGEGSSASGCIYQISNQNCLYMTDDEILSLVYSTANKIAIAEFDLQRKLFETNPDQITDKVMRAWGKLTNALLLSSEETAECLVWIKLGICLGILNFKNNKIIDDLFFVTKPATLLTTSGAELHPMERDKLRALQVKGCLLSSVIK